MRLASLPAEMPLLKNGFKDITDFLHNVRGQYCKKLIKLDFEKTLLLP